MGNTLKRNVRYDDADRTLVMDVCYPGAQKWERISYAQAIHGIEMSKPEEAEAPHKRTLPHQVPLPASRPQYMDWRDKSTTQGSMSTATRPTGSSSATEDFHTVSDEEPWTSGT